ncbi:MAG: hypothetical protein C4574_00830 [Candidatus Latescibacterota bacterium]|nr:MAG: hypothetical protein C4574_00830 [Candidatus Latescibacterota bacterium]
MTRAVTRTPEWWQQRSPAFLASCARLVEERVGADRLRGLVLCGSFATGDESIVLETEPPILLSDVDLAAVVGSLADLERWSPRRTELGAACEALLPEVRFAGRVDVGIMLPRDLAALPARPGVLDMKSAGRVLAGDPEILSAVPAYGPRDVPAREAVILVENRIAALLGLAAASAGPADEEWYRFRYEIAKVYTDVAAAALSVAGSYRAGYAERARIVSAAAGDPGSLLGRLVDEPLARRIASWTRFKIAPSRDSAAGADEGGGAEAAWERAASDLERFRALAASVAVSGEAGLSRPPSAERLAKAGRRAGTARDRLRSWRGYLARIGPRRAIEIAIARGAGMLAAFPDDVVREHAARLLSHRVRLGAGAPVARPPGGFPYRAAAWNEAASQLSAAWRGIVFGREDS